MLLQTFSILEEKGIYKTTIRYVFKSVKKWPSTKRYKDNSEQKKHKYGHDLELKYVVN